MGMWRSHGDFWVRPPRGRFGKGFVRLGMMEVAIKWVLGSI